MPKRLAAKIETYTKDGQQKGKYIDVGVILSNENGEYVMLNPTVSLAGILTKQRILAGTEGRKPPSNVMCSIFDNDNQNQRDFSGQQNRTPPPQQNAPGQAPAQVQGGDQGENFDHIPF